MFDILLNPHALDAESATLNDPDEVFFTGVFYFVVNCAFILILSQFLIAVLCGSFDAVREEQKQTDELEQIPHGYTPIQVEVHTTSAAVINFFRFESLTAGLPSWRLIEVFTEHSTRA